MEELSRQTGMAAGSSFCSVLIVFCFAIHHSARLKTVVAFLRILPKTARPPSLASQIMIAKAILTLVGAWMLSVCAQAQSSPVKPAFSKTIRVILDNDFSGDPDGLFALAHLLLSPSVETRGIIGSHIGVADFIDPSDKQATNAAEKANKVLEKLHLTGQVPLYTGSNTAMPNDSTPVQSEAVDFIIRECLRTDTRQPLYILCGAGLTEVGSALLKNPSIQGKFTLIWIGGPEYPSIALPPPKGARVEYNMHIDIPAARVVFNRSTVALWQVPRDAYRQAIVPYARLELEVKPMGEIGSYLFQELTQLMNKLRRTGETYILGDSPLVLLTALQTYFEPDAASSSYVTMRSPAINSQGLYEENPAERSIRVYTRLDVPLMLNDFFAKLELHHLQNKQ